jgi:hypothetical protein
VRERSAERNPMLTAEGRGPLSYGEQRALEQHRKNCAGIDNAPDFRGGDRTFESSASKGG